MSRIGKSLETESRLEVGGRENEEFISSDFLVGCCECSGKSGDGCTTL